MLKKISTINNRFMLTDSDKIIGTWKLLSFELIKKNTGKTFYPYGTTPIGTLIFSVDNFMAVAIMADNRASLSVESIQMANEQEKVKAIETYLSYSGTWKIENDKIFVNVIVSLIPNWTNKEHFRYFQIFDNTLTFQTPTIKHVDQESYIELSWIKNERNNENNEPSTPYISLTQNNTYSKDVIA